MLILLHLLEEALENCTNGHYDSAHIAGICLQLQVDIPRRFAQYTDASMAEADFARYHRQLVALYACSLTTQNETILAAVGKLLGYHERLYNDLLDPAEPLPIFHVDILKAAVYDDLPGIAQQLEAKKVPDSYLRELHHAMDALFAEDKPPALTYHHRVYLPHLIGMLKQLAADRRPKDWSKRFVESLVNYNFNYMGFFNRWQEMHDMEFEAALQTGRAPELVAGWYDTLQHHAAIPDMALHPRQLSLLDHMGLYIASKATSLLEGKEAGPMQPSPAVDTSLNSGLLSLDFHYRYKLGYYPYSNKLEAAKAYSTAHHSKTGRHISPNTLMRFDKTELYEEAIVYHSDLAKIIKQLRVDFRL